jgi:hypothetical protein
VNEAKHKEAHTAISKQVELISVVTSHPLGKRKEMIIWKRHERFLFVLFFIGQYYFG